MRTLRLCCALLLLLAAPVRAAEPFTNTATLSVSFDGTNVLLRADFAQTNGAYTLLQAARPDALTLPPCSCQISNQILDLGSIVAMMWVRAGLPRSRA